MAKSVKSLYKSGYSLQEMANILGKSYYSINKTVKKNGYNTQFIKEHRAFNLYKNGHKIKTVSKVLGKSESTFYKELKKSGHKRDLQDSHNDDFVKRTREFLKKAKNKNYNSYVVAKADYDNDLMQSWKKKGRKIPKYFFKGIRAKSDVRDLSIPASISHIHYFDSSGKSMSKKQFKSLYSYDIKTGYYGDKEE